MKTKMLWLASVFLAGGLMAADPPRAARRAAADAPPNRPQAGLAGAIGGLGAFEQVLTDEQREKFREYMQANAEKSRSSQQELFKLRRELQEAVMTGKADETFIKEKSEAIAKLDGELLQGRMSAMAKVAVTLTPEQKEKIKEMSEQMRGARPGLGAGPRGGGAPPTREPAAPPPPEK